MNPPKRILVATDFSDTANAAVEYAVTFAKSVGAKVTVLHVYWIPSYSYPDVLVPTPPGMALQIEEGAKSATRAACAPYASSGVEIEPVVRDGTAAWLEIDRVAQDRLADLVILGTHGRTGIPRALLGSVAEKVLRTSTCPVLVVPLKTKKAA